MSDEFSALQIEQLETLGAMFPFFFRSLFPVVRGGCPSAIR